MSAKKDVEAFVAASDAATATLGPLRGRWVHVYPNPESRHVALLDGGLVLMGWKRLGRPKPVPVVIPWGDVTSIGFSETQLLQGPSVLVPSRRLRIVHRGAAGEPVLEDLTVQHRYVDAIKVWDEMAAATFALRRDRAVGAIAAGGWAQRDLVVREADVVVTRRGKERSIPLGSVQAVLFDGKGDAARLVLDVAGPTGVETVKLPKLVDVADPDLVRELVMEGSLRARGIGSTGG